jgi:hypothetical protein
MQADKLVGRMEEVSWNSPYLTFSIERHGSTVNGSTRAEVQHWRVHISSMKAELVSSSRRQLYPTATRMYVHGIAMDLVDTIIHTRQSSSLKWYPDGRVKVLIGTIIPDKGFRQTIAGRRKRFRVALEEQLAKHDWTPVATNTYQLKSV